MSRTILYRLLGMGSVPKKVLPVLKQEGIVVLDEGIGGRFMTKHVDGPGKRYRNRSEGFSGCLAVTKKRVLCYTYGKRQISIAVDDPKMAKLYVDAPDDQSLSLTFESSDFREDWQGIFELRFSTEKALLFRDALIAAGAQPGRLG